MRKPEDLTIVAVVAVARNGVIGRDGVMPWHIPSDLKRYRKLTMGKPMIMGRRTLASIGRVLDGRDSIVLTRAPHLDFEGALIANSPAAALDLAADRARSRGTDEIVIAGGAEIYGLFLSMTDRVEMTEIDLDPSGDTSFPALREDDWSRSFEGAWEKGLKDSAPSRATTLVRHIERARG